MVVILVALTFLIFIFAQILIVQRLARRQAEKIAEEKLSAAMTRMAEPEAGRVAGLAFASDVRYHPGHTWVDLNSAAVPVGADDFTLKFVGKIERLECLPVGVEVKKGQPIWRILFGDRWVVQKAPVSGRIVAVNERVLKDPNQLAESPYGDGWIVKILPESLSTESAGLFTRESFAKIADRAISKLLGRLKPALGEVYTDAGALLHGAARQIDEELWDEIVGELFEGEGEVEQP